MGSVNKVLLVGHVGLVPELKRTAAGMAVCNLSIATNERVKDGDGYKERVEWHRVVCWKDTAENVAKYVAKGRQVYVEGRLQTRSWEDKEKVTRYSTDIIADRVIFLGPGDKAGQEDKPANNGKAKHREERLAPPADDDDRPGWM